VPVGTDDNIDKTAYTRGLEVKKKKHKCLFHYPRNKRKKRKYRNEEKQKKMHDYCQRLLGWMDTHMVPDFFLCQEMVEQHMHAKKKEKKSTLSFALKSPHKCTPVRKRGRARAHTHILSLSPPFPPPLCQTHTHTP